ncbi:MAG: DUF2244 domain-containing protein [Proteobacteria bacterium]|nr:DUF2244 domain-containing protein [Pseudomonadota bacterium]
MTDENPLDDPIRYSAVLRPQRSSSRRAVKILSILVLCLFLPTALIFTAVGAWPVFGFMGIEVIALLFALRFNHKIGRTFDAIAITDDEFRLSRVDPWGRRRQWKFQSRWLQIRLDGPLQRLTVGSHGRTVAIGTFLTPDERARLAADLKSEIAKIALPAVVG